LSSSCLHHKTIHHTPAGAIFLATFSLAAHHGKG
jgi:hypothetical protein